jgi:hypothetical protein
MHREIAAGSTIGHIKLCDGNATTDAAWAAKVAFALKKQAPQSPKGVLRRNRIALIRFA